jgi:hypothetical protein
LAVSRLAPIIGPVGLADFEADLDMVSARAAVKLGQIGQLAARSSRSNDRQKHQTGHHDAYGRPVGCCRTPGWCN